MVGLVCVSSISVVQSEVNYKKYLSKEKIINTSSHHEWNCILEFLVKTPDGKTAILVTHR